MGGATIITTFKTGHDAVNYLKAQADLGEGRFNLLLRYASIIYNDKTKEYEVAIRLTK